MRRIASGKVRFVSNSFQRLLGTAIGDVRRAFAITRKPRAYVAFSGGKDSIATAALVHYVRDDVPLVWSDDELEFPETVELMEFLRLAAPDHFLAYQAVSIHAGWFGPWRSSPYFRDPLPGTRISDLPYDQALRRDGYNLTFLGVRAAESGKRRGWLLSAGANYHAKDGGVRSCPMAGWSTDDVWALIAGWGLGYNRAYARFEALGLPDFRWRVGPLPLVPRDTLADGWPDLLERLETRYGPKWG